ncbi:DUF1484 family protein [Chromobacterium paludis]|uniref:DUF1484 family protein n=1 Tax=Chromobacterium paludis TaxID=2605945 RepID=A0A5C1DKP9_9NEIS|nr:DUF1484 family protein [Chromobacterium paludis]QEL57326.1 DUF1484 family protein [Chromobacterium paludis]
MPRVFSPHPKPRRHASARARWLGGHTLPASALPLVELNQTFAQLQSLLSHSAHADLRLPVARLARLFADIDETMTESSQTLARAANRLHSLLDMLRLADKNTLPARQLYSLLMPLYQQLLQARFQLEGRG